MKHHKIKLDDLEKKQLFTVPEGYFEELPTIIQSRVMQKPKAVWWQKVPVTVRWAAVPALIVLLFLVLWKAPTEQQASPEQLLTEVSIEDITHYLGDYEISTEELLQEIDWEDTEELEEDNMWMEDITEEELDELLLDYEITGEYF